MNSIQAEPFPLEFNPYTSALIIIDMQRDFVRVASSFPELQRIGLERIKALGAIFGWVPNSDNFIKVMS